MSRIAIQIQYSGRARLSAAEEEAVVKYVVDRFGSREAALEAYRASLTEADGDTDPRTLRLAEQWHAAEAAAFDAAMADWADPRADVSASIIVCQ